MYEYEYMKWYQRSVMADCFRALGLNGLAIKIMKVEQIDQYLPIIKSEAKRVNNLELLTYLASNGLLTKECTL